MAAGLPLVSIVTPSLNQAQFIRETILSVATQDYPHIEHTVVDGGSTDGTVNILRQYPVLQWVSEPDRGQSDAINKGLRRARGEIVAWLNSDDVYLPGAVTRAVRALQAKPGTAMVYCNFLEIDENGAERSRVKAPPFDLDGLVNVRNYILQPTVFLLKSVLDEVGLLDTSYHATMDWDLWVRIGKFHHVEYVDDYWAAARWHRASKSARLGATRAGDFWPEARRVSRSHGGRFVSPLFVEHWIARIFGRRALVAGKLLREKRFGTFAEKLRQNLLVRR